MFRGVHAIPVRPPPSPAMQFGRRYELPAHSSPARLSILPAVERSASVCSKRASGWRRLAARLEVDW
jgi:hypothetical protein